MPARFCPQCHHEVPSTARFCANCAAILPGPDSVTPPAMTVQSPKPVDPIASAVNKSRRALMVVALAALVVMATGFVVLALRPAQPIVANNPAPPDPAPPLVAIPTATTPSPPITAVPTTPVDTPPITAVPTVAPGVLPPDVAAYVKFLQGIEERRVALSNDMSSAQAMLGLAHQMQASQTDPEQHNATVPDQMSKINQGFTEYTNKWQVLIRDFNATTPPFDCKQLANDYGKFLTDYVATISKLEVALMNSDVSQAMALQGAQKQITDVGLLADKDLGDICSRYNAPRPFSIQPDGASPSVIAQ